MSRNPIAQAPSSLAMMPDVDLADPAPPIEA